MQNYNTKKMEVKTYEKSAAIESLTTIQKLNIKSKILQTNKNGLWFCFYYLKKVLVNSPKD